MQLSARNVLWPLLMILAGTSSSGAQVIDDVEELQWDRPEAWAMKYFSSVSIFTGLGPPRNREPWSFELGLELDSIPHLTEDQRRVGFGGAKVEDINRLPAFFRPRLTIGLPARWSLDVAYVPPVEIRGVKSHLFAVAGERPVHASGPWTLGIRLYGQIGRVDGVLDRTLLLANGWTWSVNGGAGWALGGKFSLAVELFYSPLSVVRPPSATVENDPLLNLRTILRIKL